MEIVTAIAGILALAALAVSLIVWWWRRRFTRQRYAFWAGSAILLLALTVISSLVSLPPWLIAADLVARLVGVDYHPPQATLETQLLLVVFASVISWMLYLIHRNWDGERTRLSFELERRNASWAMLAEAYAELDRKLHRRPHEPAHDEKLERPKLHISDLEREELSFKDQVLEALKIRLPGLQVTDYAWHPEGSCFVCPNEQLNETVIACCVGGETIADAARTSVEYGLKLSSKHAGDVRLMLFTEQPVDIAVEAPGHVVFQRHVLDRYIESLVDLREYLASIRRRVETEKLPNSDTTLRQAYAPLRISVEYGGLSSEVDVNDYLERWANNRDEQHAALLADYGQGKSTCALYFCYMVATGQLDIGRIPILIELRGRSPKSMNMLEFLSAWGALYGIDGRALLFLVRARKILLIFEGFDELDEAGTFLQRSSHFSALWRFATRGSKLLFTGRPNFFLDEIELTELLMAARAATSGPSLQICRLLPMNEQEVETSLRWADASTQFEILQLFESDSGFREMASRPSLLYQIAVVWRRSDLRLEGHSITAAEVIGRFLRDTQRRQTLKASSERRFMLLNEAEQLFFMRAVACYMAHHRRANQIPAHEIESVVRAVYEKIPLDYRFPRLLPSHELSDNPLRSRLSDRLNAIEDLTTEVRSHALLLTDTSSQGSLKFAHKSYFEYLVAETFADRLLMERRVETDVIEGSTPMRFRMLMVNFLSVRLLCQMIAGHSKIRPARHFFRAASELTFRGLPGLMSESMLLYFYRLSPSDKLRYASNAIINSDDPSLYEKITDGISDSIQRRLSRLVALAMVLATVGIFLGMSAEVISNYLRGDGVSYSMLENRLGTVSALSGVLAGLLGFLSSVFSFGLGNFIAQRRLGMRSEIVLALVLVAIARGGTETSIPT